MKSNELRIAEAIAALTAVFERDQVDGASRKAHDFVNHHLLQEGWRPTGPVAYRPTPGGDRKGHPNTARREAGVARENIAEGKAAFAAREEGRRLARSDAEDGDQPYCSEHGGFICTHLPAERTEP